VAQTVIFGDGLHVSGTDAAVLEHSIHDATAGRKLRAEPIDTSLEDVFIYMMSQTPDNFGGRS
jgi:ABC-2 type transport system ATP-binding protein